MRELRNLLLAFSLFSGVSSFNSGATNYYVNDALTGADIYTIADGAGGNDGLSTSTPKATLTQIWNTYGPTGTNVITSGDFIYIDAGTYFTTDANLALSVSGISIVGAGSTLTFFDNNQSSADANRWANVTGNNITIQGIYLTGYNYAFGGASTLNISAATNITIIDVETTGNAAGGGSSAIVINGGSTVSFSGGGSNCNPGSPSVAGGGMNVEGNGNTVTIDNYALLGNTKDLQGGSGLYISGDNTTTVTLTNSVVANNVNTSAAGGAGIFVSGSNFNMSGCCITTNSTNSGSGPKYGGAICVARGATLVISDCAFSGNTVSNSGKGGAIAINTSFSGSGAAASVSITSCSFSGNTATSEGNHLYARVGSSNPASFSITECSFTATAQDIRQDNSATFTIQNSGSPVISGAGITMVNATPALTTPSTTCPTYVGPCFSILPVELIDFSGVCMTDHVQLEWSTASEYNNDYFIIERGNQVGTFSEIARVNVAGSSQSILRYNLRDTALIDGENYYRLTQVDYDGESEVFTIISVNPCVPQAELMLSYSMEERVVYASFDGEPNQQIEFHLYNSMGTLVYQSATRSHVPQSNIGFTLPSNISTGLFIGRVTTSTESNSITLFTK